MSRLSRWARIAVAGLLAVSALTVFGASPASAAATGSLVDNGDGTATLTYSGSTATDYIVLLGLPSGTTCTAGSTPPGAMFFLTSSPQATGGGMTASPMTIQTGTSAYSLSVSPPGPVTVAAGTYNLCVHNYISQQGATVLQQLEVTIGSVTPTTTSTTTAPAADPVTPAFTG